MVNEGLYDPMEKGKRYSVMHNFSGSSTVYQWLLDQEEFSVDLEQEAFGWRTIPAALFKLGNSNAA